MHIKIELIKITDFKKRYLKETGTKKTVLGRFQNNTINYGYRWQKGNSYGYIQMAFPELSKLTYEGENIKVQTFLKSCKEDKNEIFKFYKKISHQFVKAIGNIYYKNPNLLTPALYFIFSGIITEKQGIIMSGMGGDQINASLDWINWMIKANHKSDKISDYFARTTLHEKQHLYDVGIGSKILFEGIARLKEYIYGSHLFNYWKKDLKLVHKILKNDLPKHPQFLEYKIGLYTWLIILIKYLEDKCDEKIIIDFKKEHLNKKFEILEHLTKHIHKSKSRTKILVLISDYFEEINKYQSSNKKIMSKFRNTEKEFNLPKLPKEYLENF